MINTKADIKQFLQQKGIQSIVVNKRNIRLDNAATVDLRKVALREGYGQI